MAEEIKLQIISLERKIFDGQVESVILPTPQGDAGILSHHEPLITALEGGQLRYVQKSESRLVAVSGGFAEIANNQLIVLADAAEHAEDIDISRAEEAKKRAEQTMKERGRETLEFKEAAAAFRRSVTRLRIADQIKKRRSSQRVHLNHDQG